MAIVRAISANIFEDKRIGNCSNNGISARFDHVLIICDDGWIDVDLDNPPENLCVFVERKLFGGDEANYIRPYADPKGAGWMSGGSLIYSSDSRFPGGKPLCFHDRQESWEMYDLLSR